MSRFDGDYDEDFPGQWGLYEGARKQAFSSKHGQAKLRELREAILALPEPKLIQSRLVDSTGGVCAMGALAVHTRVKAGEDRSAVIADLSPEGPDEDEYGPLWDTFAEEGATIEVGVQLGVRKTMAIDIAWHNDLHSKETPEERYTRVLKWLDTVIREEKT